jgi:hypothetical protein
MLDKSDIVDTTTDTEKFFNRARRYEKAVEILQDPHGNIITINRNLIKYQMPPILTSGVHKRRKF